jgi:hypothetical protein
MSSTSIFQKVVRALLQSNIREFIPSQTTRTSFSKRYALTDLRYRVLDTNEKLGLIPSPTKETSWAPRGSHGSHGDSDSASVLDY